MTRPEIRFLTWNVHGCVGRDRLCDLDRVARVLDAAQPDISALQEIDSRTAGAARDQFSYFGTLFGWKKTETMDMGEAGLYQMYGIGGRTLGGMFNKPADVPAVSWLYYIHVADVNQTVEKMKSLGGTLCNGPMEVPGGDLIAQCTDPQGAAFALHSSK